MMWVLSEYYSKNLSKETKKGHRELALKGLHNGGVPPFGYDVVDRHYVINETEAAYVRRMFDSVIKRQPHTQLIEELKSEGIRGKRGKFLSYPSIYEILRNEKYTGTYLYSIDEEADRMDRRTKPNAIRIDNAFPAIISKKTFKEVQEIMDSRKMKGKHSDYLCRGIVYCTCGAKMHATVWRIKGGRKHVYRCKDDCGMKPIPMELVDKAATDYLREFLSPEMQLKIAAFLRNYKNHQSDARSGFEAARKKQITEKQATYDNLMKNMMSGVLSPEVMKDINDRMTAIKGEIETLEKAEPPKDYTMETILEWLESIKKAPDQRAVELLIKKITVSRENNKTDFKIESNLKSVCVEMVAGGGLEPPTSGL
ncbi:MAG: recombinase family protein [Clostridia bacterium]|nr:recombinase family protein [Clostridia bacterium]